jgi:hypothetical protein
LNKLCIRKTDNKNADLKGSAFVWALRDADEAALVSMVTLIVTIRTKLLAVLFNKNKKSYSRQVLKLFL